MIADLMIYRLELNHLVPLNAATPAFLPFHTLHRSCLANDIAQTNFIRVSFQLQRWSGLFRGHAAKISCFRRF